MQSQTKINYDFLNYKNNLKDFYNRNDNQSNCIAELPQTTVQSNLLTKRAAPIIRHNPMIKNLTCLNDQHNNNLTNCQCYECQSESNDKLLYCSSTFFKPKLSSQNFQKPKVNQASVVLPQINDKLYQLNNNSLNLNNIKLNVKSNLKNKDKIQTDNLLKNHNFQQKNTANNLTALKDQNNSQNKLSFIDNEVLNKEYIILSPKHGKIYFLNIN